MNQHSDSQIDSQADLQTDSGNLLEHPALWRAGELAREPEAVASGFDTLDRHLPGRGWPRAGLCEFMLPGAGVGELQLLLPALRTLSRQARWIAWVNPPFIPYAPALQAAGVDIDKILLIHPRNHKDALWALERATRSGNCSAALAWLDEAQLKTRDTQRLQFAARQGGTLSCLFRPGSALKENSMAELRLSVRPADPATASAARNATTTLHVNISKRRGGWPLADLPVVLDEGRHPGEIHEQLSLWRQWRATDPLTPVSQRQQIPALHSRQGYVDLHPPQKDAGHHVTH